MATSLILHNPPICQDNVIPESLNYQIKNLATDGCEIFYLTGLKLFHFKIISHGGLPLRESSRDPFPISALKDACSYCSANGHYPELP